MTPCDHTLGTLHCTGEHHPSHTYVASGGDLAGDPAGGEDS